METYLLMHTDASVRRVLGRVRPGRMVLACPDVGPEDRAVYDECIVLPPVDRVEETLRRVEAVAADHVYFQTEFGLPAGSLLARARGLPGPSAEAVLACLDKHRSRTLLAEAGVPVPSFALVETAEDVRRLGWGWPVVLKAGASTLGRLVKKVEGPESLDAAVAAMRRALPRSPDVRRLVELARLADRPLGYDPTRRFLVERFAAGPPRECDGLVVGDAVHPFGVTDQVVRDGDGFYIEGYLLPSDEPGRAEEVAVAAVRASGLADTGFSVELRGDVVIEVNGRLGEDDGFAELFHAALGAYPFLHALARDARPLRPVGRHALAYLNAYAPGTLRALRTGEGVVPVLAPGDRVAEPGTPEYLAHVAYAICSDPASSRAAYERARARIAGVVAEFE
jgi:hypothetical protein